MLYNLDSHKTVLALPWDYCSCKMAFYTETSPGCKYYSFDTNTTDVLVIQGARASADMVMTYLSQNICVSAQHGNYLNDGIIWGAIFTIID